LVAAGTLMCLFLVPGPPKDQDMSQKLSGSGRARELLRGITILSERPKITLAVIIRVICNLTLYGFPLMMPLYLTGQLSDSKPWFSQLQWMTLWATMNTITILTNIMWGRLGDRFGWMRQMRWFGFVGMALATLCFGYFPQLFPGNMPLMFAAATLFAVSVTAFVPMGAVFPALAPQHRGAAISAHNLASGVTTFLGPGIATLFLPIIGSLGVIWVYVILCLLGTLTTFFIKPYQEGVTDEGGQMLPRAERIARRQEA